MNGTRVGGQIVSVTLHEPRKLRPEKVAERRALDVSMGYGRQAIPNRRSSSPVRTDRRGRTDISSDEPKASRDSFGLAMADVAVGSRHNRRDSVAQS